MGKIKDSTIDEEEFDRPIYDSLDELDVIDEDEYISMSGLGSLLDICPTMNNGVTGSGDYLYTLPEGMSIDTSKMCPHTDLIDYIGFNQKYRYCRKCDHKEYT